MMPPALEGTQPNISSDAAPVGRDYYTLSPLVIPLFTAPRLAAKEIDLRKPPSFLQTSGGKLKKDLFLPFSFYRFLAQIKTLALTASHPTTPRSSFGAFEEPRYDVLAQMLEVDVYLFQINIARCIWEAYDIEWWFIVKERAYQRRRNTAWRGFAGVKKELIHFPKTESEYQDWRDFQGAHPLLARSTSLENGKIEISDVGKST
jgi:hypothetical protein